MVRLAVVVLILDEEVFVAAVAGKGNSRNAQAGETALEALPAGVGSGISPGLAIGDGVLAIVTLLTGRDGDDQLSLPGIVSWLTGGLFKGPHVEAGDVGLGPAVGGS